MREELYAYDGHLYPAYLKTGNACQHIAATALHFCKGRGLDIGASQWPLPGAEPIELTRGHDGNGLPEGEWDYIFSSHMLEHVVNPVAAIEHWQTRLRSGGVLFLYLPSPEMRYWHPSRCRRHLHVFYPKDVVNMLQDLQFVDVINSERDLAWSFSVVGWKR